MAYDLTFEEGRIREFEKNVLALDTSGYFMPMSFVGFENKEYVTYDCSGYIPVSRWNMMHTELMLEIIERVILILSHSGEYLILPERITLNENTVFYNRENREVKIAYIPNENNDAGKNIMMFLMSMKDKIPENERFVITKLIQMTERNNYSIRELLNVIIAIKRKFNEAKIKTAKEVKGKGKNSWFEK